MSTRSLNFRDPQWTDSGGVVCTLCGIPYVHLVAMANDWGGGFIAVENMFIALVYLRTGLPLGILTEILSLYLPEVCTSITTVYRRIQRALLATPVERQCMHLARFAFTDPQWPNFTGAVDGVPVYCRGGYDVFNGKHHRKCVVFQVMVDLTGRPIAWSDGAKGFAQICLQTGIGGNHASHELWFADTGYMAFPHCVTSHKANMKSVWAGKKKRKKPVRAAPPKTEKSR